MNTFASYYVQMGGSCLAATGVIVVDVSAYSLADQKFAERPISALESADMDMIDTISVVAPAIG